MSPSLAQSGHPVHSVTARLRGTPERRRRPRAPLQVLLFRSPEGARARARTPVGRHRVAPAVRPGKGGIHSLPKPGGRPSPSEDARRAASGSPGREAGEGALARPRYSTSLSCSTGLRPFSPGSRLGLPDAALRTPPRAARVGRWRSPGSGNGAGSHPAPDYAERPGSDPNASNWAASATRRPPWREAFGLPGILPHSAQRMVQLRQGTVQPCVRPAFWQPLE
jgi:hypothetical protein